MAIKRLSKRNREIVYSNPIVKSIMEEEIILLYNTYEFNNMRRYASYFKSILSLDNWESNCVLYMNYKYEKYSPSKSGLYDVDYVALKYNVSTSKAKEIVNKIKKDKTTNKDGFIKRHGAEKGMKLFEKFQETSISNDGRYSEYELKCRSHWCKEFYMIRGHSESESIELARKCNKVYAGANKYYWLSKGLSYKEIERKTLILNRRRSHACILHHCANIGFELKEYMETIKDRDKYTYYKECMRYTNISLMLYNVENIEMRGNEMSLDHIYSVNMGFLNKVDPKYIGHITNLKMVTKSYNSSKGAKCDKSLSDLINDYNHFETHNK